MSQHKGPPELCLDCARDRARDERAPRRRLWPRIDMLEAQTAELYALRSQLEAVVQLLDRAAALRLMPAVEGALWRHDFASLLAEKEGSQ